MRTFDRIGAVLLALVGFVAGILMAVEIAYRALGNDGHLLVPYESSARALRSSVWSSAPVVVVAVVCAVLGLLLLVAELKPRRPDLLVLESTDPDVTVALPRSSVVRVVEHATADLPGVESVSGKVRGRSVTLTARTPLESPGDLSDAVTGTARGALADLHLRRTPPVTVRVQKGTS